MDKKIRVQTLTPPLFTPSGIVKDRTEAWVNKEWMGAFNLWIVQRNPVPAIVYQLRNPTIWWAPGKLDVSAAGHYEELETIKEGLREVKEELDKVYDFDKLIPLGRKINVGVGQDGSLRNTVNDIFLIEDDAPLSSYKLEEREVFAICVIPVSELLKVHTIEGYDFEATGVKFDGLKINITVNRDSFPLNWDNYHYKIALLVQRYFDGDTGLIY